MMCNGTRTTFWNHLCALCPASAGILCHPDKKDWPLMAFALIYQIANFSYLEYFEHTLNRQHWSSSEKGEVRGRRWEKEEGRKEGSMDAFNLKVNKLSVKYIAGGRKLQGQVFLQLKKAQSLQSRRFLGTILEKFNALYLIKNTLKPPDSGDWIDTLKLLLRLDWI